MNTKKYLPVFGFCALLLSGCSSNKTAFIYSQDDVYYSPNDEKVLAKMYEKNEKGKLAESKQKPGQSSSSAHYPTERSSHYITPPYLQMHYGYFNPYNNYSYYSPDYYNGYNYGMNYNYNNYYNPYYGSYSGYNPYYYNNYNPYPYYNYSISSGTNGGATFSNTQDKVKHIRNQQTNYNISNTGVTNRPVFIKKEIQQPGKTDNPVFTLPDENFNLQTIQPVNNSIEFTQPVHIKQDAPDALRYNNNFIAAPNTVHPIEEKNTRLQRNNFKNDNTLKPDNFFNQAPSQNQPVMQMPQQNYSQPSYNQGGSNSDGGTIHRPRH